MPSSNLVVDLTSDAEDDEISIVYELYAGLPAPAPEKPSKKRRREVVDLDEETAPCERCGVQIPLSFLLNHEKHCSEAKSGAVKDRCPWCWRKFVLVVLQGHVGQCSKSIERFRDAGWAIAHAHSLRDLVECQKKALEHVWKIAKQASARAMAALEVKVEGLGFSRKQLQAALTYLRDRAPVIIHFQPQVVEKLLKDTHYRNLFEVSPGAAHHRKTWERSMFGPSYDRAKGHERVKYGCLNFTGAFDGVKVASLYGQFYLLLAPHVRVRCTFWTADTGGFASSSNNKLGTCEHQAHLLLDYPDAELKLLMEVGSGKKSWGASSARVSSYKEIQVHGDVDLRRDVEALVVPEVCAEVGTAKAFAEKFSVNLIQV